MARKSRKHAPDEPVPAGALLVRERDHLRRILEASPVGVVTVTLDGRIDYANGRAAEILGESAKSLLGQTYESVAARSVDSLGEPIPPRQQLLQRLLCERPPMLVVHRVCVHPDGRRVPVQLAGSLLADARGRPDGALLMLREMTAQARAEETLLASGQFLETMLKHAPVPIFAHSTEGRMRLVNRAAAAMFGLKPEDMVGRTLQELLPEDMARQFVKNNARVLSSGVPLVFSDRLSIAGEERYLQSAVFPLTDSQGNIEGVGGIALDITDRFQAEDALREANQLLEAIVRASPLAVTSVDAGGARLTLWNPAAERIFGWKAKEVLGGPPPFIGDEVREEFAEILRRVLSGESIQGLDVRRRRKDGSTVDVRLSVAPLRDAAGNVIGSLGLHEDITDRKRIEEALRESEAEYRAMVDDTPAMVVRFLPDGTLTFVNEACCRYGGVPREAIIGMNFLDHIPEEDRERVRRQYTSLTAENPIVSYTHRIVYKDGSLRWLRRTDRVLMDDQGRVTGYQSIGQDITERRKARRRLAKYQRRLRSLASDLVLSEERERRRITVILHDTIGQTLAMAKMRLQVLEAAGKSDGGLEAVHEVRQLLERAIRDTRSLTMDLSPPVLYELGFPAAVEWLLEGLREKHGLRTFFENDSQPMALAEDVRVAVFLAVRELLMNVVKHAEAKKVKVSVRRTDNQLRVKVTDDGKGFDAAAVTAPGSRAAGFGLFNIREHLQHLDGRFTIQSRPGRGSVATLAVPLAAEFRQGKGASH